MQNFTFGRKGLNWFLFAFILFVGNLASYGQSPCATPDADQSYCYLETVDDLRYSGATNPAVYETADTENDTDPINGDELLTDGATYFIGSTTEDCERVAVEVTVFAADTPSNTVTGDSNGFTVTPCESSDFSGSDLLNLFDPVPSGYTLKIYEDEFGGSEISDYSTTLMDGESYFVGADTDGTSDPDSDYCPSERVAVGIDVVDAPAPTAEDPQTFCEGATVADLEAESTSPNFQAFRWYREETGGSPLANGVELINGEDYWVSQIVNERGSIFPPCESGRTRVEVEVITFDAGDDVSETFCQSQIEMRLDNGESPEDIFLSLVDGRTLPPNVEFNPDLGAIGDDYNDDPFQTFTTIATFTTDEGCEDDVELSLTIIEDADAGEDGSVTLSPSDAPINLIDYLNGTPDTGGMWTPGDGTFDPSTDTPGDFTYSVDNGSCSDSAIVTVIVEECTTTAGDDSLGNIVCRDDLDLPASQDAVRAYFRALLSVDATSEGTFSNIADIRTRVNAGEAGPFNTTYTVGAGTNCEDTAEFSVTIVDNTIANAGDFDSFTISCGSSDPVDLTSLENNDPDATAGGTFSGTGVTNNTFDPSIGAGTYTITYSVDDSLPCISGNASTTFEITVESDGTNAGDDSLENIVCRDDLDLPASQDAVRAYFRALLSVDATSEGTFSNIADIRTRVNAGEAGPFNTTYTVGAGTSCEDTAEFSVTIVDNTIANAGDFDSFTISCGSSDPVDLTSLENNDPDATAGGTFSGTGVTDNTFNPSIEAGTYTITYSVDDSLPCISGNASTTFEITVEDSPINTSISRTLCVTDVQDLIDNPAAGLAYLQSLVEEAGVDSFDEDNFSDNALAEAIRLANFIDTPTSDSETFNFEYTDPSDSDCEDGLITVAITINNLEEAEAGDFDSFDVTCTSDNSIDLTGLDNNNPDATAGGTFTGTGVMDNNFDPSVGTGTYTITYTVDDSLPCTTGSASTTFEITVENEGDNAGDDSLDNTVCRDDLDLPASTDAVRAYFRSLLSNDATTGGTFSNLADIRTRVNAGESGPFNTTYTVGASTDCQDSADFSVTIIDPTPANSGNFDNFSVCSLDDSLNLETLDNNDPDATMGGTFTGTGVTDNTFDPSIGAGTYTITYTVDESIDCTTGNDSTTFEITVEESPVSVSISRTLCVTDAQDLINNPAAGLAYLQSLVEEAGVDSFDEDNFSDATPAEAIRLANFIDTPTSDSETFNFEYIDPSDSDCEDGLITVAITINDLRDAEAGDIEDQTVCSTDGMIDLTTFFTPETVPGGTFSGMGVEDSMFNSSIGPNADGYEITYSVDDSGDCIKEGANDSTTFTIFVNEGFNAGDDSLDNTVCQGELDLPASSDSVRAYFRALLSDDATRGGTFSNVADIRTRLNAGETGPFNTTYTVGAGTSCEDTAEFSVSIVENIPAEIGEIANPDPICRNAEDVDLFSFLPADANPNGTFEGYEDGVFSPVMEGAGTFDITYTLTDDSPCTEGEASATFAITVLESAYAGMDMDLNVCMSDDVQNLFDFISVDADDDGEFSLDGEVIADGMMNPADFEAGEYEVVYTVAAINDCGDDTAEFTITVQEAPDAPTVEGDPFTFCATDGAIAADLSATGTNLTYYSDEALSMMVAAEDVLVDGTYYVTQRNDDGACESAATEFTVTINDAATPTISNTTQEFCEFDDATIADLTELINETGTITWYDSADGDNAINSGTSLQDGVTYYATLFNVDTGCESSVRLGITVSINDDCPLTIPEGFSPNDDQLNDRFEIRNIRDKYPNFTIEIRNRFGDVVYKGNANTPDWDGYSTEGSFGSDVLPVGAYFYYLRYNDGSTEPVRGTVYLSR
ncbi:gliding motility-associated C-terminal domain-containing protein [Christiangramia sediminis]|uniref:Gliding motility-associated C-terminal domain-containing protein n=1 Tax=Christiangramia sediminis TaxID=2881336 RepID=A0A9X1LJ81_9FLAO|nr:gliding motility-associated C-terminal domain-containing protein [Christiangramia sediminis]MCB7481244.1 gliding motility-associated C-terminal domain-containing protein [Christiangramia sediminis]